LRICRGALDASGKKEIGDENNQIAWGWL